MTALRQFLSRREAEVVEQIKLLERELAEIRTTWAALQKDSGVQPSASSGITIKEMIKRILPGRPDGLTAGEILQEIHARFDVQIERTSLSPQLSRLRDSGDVTLQNGRWYSSQILLSNLEPPERPLPVRRLPHARPDE